MSNPAKFTIESRTDTAIIIRDVGPWDQHATITNDAEFVVERLGVKPGQRIFYYDSDGIYGELLVKNGKFAGFAIAYPESTGRRRDRDEPWRR